MKILSRFGCACGLWLVGCASAPAAKPTDALTPERLYPLAAGSAWSYDVDMGTGEMVLAITRVTEAGGGQASVQGGEGTTRYEIRPDGIYRVAGGGYLLKAPLKVGARWSSGQGMQAEIIKLDAAVESPAGRFTRCVEVLERGASSGALITTTYCPDVGPALVVSELSLQTGEVKVVARLRGYQIGDGSRVQTHQNPATQE
jgi:hypothetical protein